VKFYSASKYKITEYNFLSLH